MRVPDKTPRPAASLASNADGIPAAARRHTGSSGQALAACALGALVLALLSSPELPSSADRFGDGPLTERIREAASGWQEMVGRADLTLAHRVLRQATQWLIDSQWPQINGRVEPPPARHFESKSEMPRF
jgi:hypothetical protein